MSGAELVPVGTLCAIPVERGGVPGVGLVEVRGYVVSGTGGGVWSAEQAAGWHALDAERDGPAARVHAVIAQLDGRSAGTYRAGALVACAARAAELLELERAVLVDLERLEVAL